MSQIRIFWTQFRQRCENVQNSPLFFFRNVFSLIFRVYTEIAIFGQYSARTASKSTFKNENFFFFSCLYSKTLWFWLYKSQDKKNKTQRQRPRKTHHTFIPYHACSRTEPVAGGWILFSNQIVRSRFGARFVSIRSRSASFVETRLFSRTRATTKVSDQKIIPRRLSGTGTVWLSTNHDRQIKYIL